MSTDVRYAVMRMRTKSHTAKQTTLEVMTRPLMTQGDADAMLRYMKNDKPKEKFFIVQLHGDENINGLFL